jgi:FHA domain
VPGKVKLEVVEGPMKGQKFTFEDRDSCIVGRQEECGIKLPSDDDHITISRYHCLLDINPPDIRIRDFGSMNGTFVNGKKIGQREKGVRAEEARQQAFPEHGVGELLSKQSSSGSAAPEQSPVAAVQRTAEKDGAAADWNVGDKILDLYEVTGKRGASALLIEAPNFRSRRA